MHIPDAYLSPATEAVAYVCMLPIWTIAAKRTAKTLSTRQSPLLAIGAAFCFAIQMFNVPAIGGTTAHALGATLLAILVGPWAALIGMSLELAIQALLFGDGGILSFPANCWDMAVVAPFVGYAIYQVLAGRTETGSPRRLIAAAIGAYGGTVAASLSAGVLLGLQPALAHDQLGHALYCPFGLNITVPAMVSSHLLVAGPVDAIVTVAALAYLWRSFPEFASREKPQSVKTPIRLAKSLVLLLILTPLGLLAAGDAFGEWDLDQLKEMIGYEPKGMVGAHQYVHPLLPDYGFAGDIGAPWQIAGYMVSAALGSALIAGFLRGILRGQKEVPKVPAKPIESSNQMPAWLAASAPVFSGHGQIQRSLLEKTALKVQLSVQKSIGAEEIAHLRGFLQAVHPHAKLLGALLILLAIGLTRSITFLAVLECMLVGSAYFSRIRLGKWLPRVAGLVAFFGLVFAVPMMLRTVTPGPIAMQLFGLQVSRTGLYFAGLTLLRLSAGISVATIWNLTTKWFELLGSLRSLRIPVVVLLTATLTYRYLFVVLETLGEMVDARRLRQVGADSRLAVRTYAGNGSAILFAKSLTLAEEMHSAMRARNIEGFVMPKKKLKWSTADFILILFSFATLSYVVIGGVLRAL